MIIRSLPKAPIEFTGRYGELESLRIKIESKDNNLIGIFGMPGVGKTALCLRLGERIKHLYPDGCFFIKAESPREEINYSEIVARNLIYYFYPHLSKIEDGNSLLGIYHSLCYEKKYLLNFENVKPADNIRDLIPNKDCLIILSSREKFCIPGLLGLEIKPFRSEEAEEYLEKIAPNLGGDASLVADLCGYLPDALSILGRLLDTLYKKDPVASHKLLQDVITHVQGYENSRIYYSLLEYTRGFFDIEPEMKKENYFKLLMALSVIPAPFTREIARELWMIGPEETQVNLNELKRHYFVDWIPGQKQYYLTPLARNFALIHLKPQDRKILEGRYQAMLL
jgi:hypothetical protein